MSTLSRTMVSVLLGAALIGVVPAMAEDTPSGLVISAPISRQVVQRDAENQAEITIRGTVSQPFDSIEAKAALLPGATNGKATDWTRIATKEAIAGGDYGGTLRLPAGGWYTIMVRAKQGEQVVAEADVDRVGVGEVFVTAGQSNSANYGASRQNATDDRVVYFNGTAYVPAKDPIPGGCGGGGSPWPLLGDLIAKSQGVPVCFRSASLQWTEVKNWLPPDTLLYKNLATCVKPFGPHGVRAVLWHQGESDTLVKTSAATYGERLKTIMEELSKDAGYTLPWFVAQTSFHPGSKAPEQQEVAKGQQMLWENKLAHQGPTTDDLLGTKYRYDGVHFNRAGLIAHAERWFDALKAHYGWQAAIAKMPAEQALPH